jgi:single-strand DNA-binding protein
MSINVVTLYGNLTADPEKMGDKGAKFRLAYSDKWTDKETGEDKERTHYVTVKVWGGQAKPVMEYLSKGKAVMISGKLELDQWEKDGEKRQAHSINANSVQFLSPKEES